jgi:hypothetical protein
LTEANNSKADKLKPLAGGVRHDARGNAVWHWATETARHAMSTTSQLLRRLDVSSLSLQEEQPPEVESKPASPPGPSSTPAASVRPGARGFNPYDGAAARPATAARNRPAAATPRAAPARARSSWWRRLLQRR